MAASSSVNDRLIDPNAPPLSVPENADSLFDRLYTSRLNDIVNTADQFRFVVPPDDDPTRRAPVIFPRNPDEVKTMQPPYSVFGPLVSSRLHNDQTVCDLATSSLQAFLRRKVVDELKREDEILDKYHVPERAYVAGIAGRLLDWIDESTLAVIEEFLDLVGVDNALLFSKWLTVLGVDMLCAILDIGTQLLNFQEFALDTNLQRSAARPGGVSSKIMSGLTAMMMAAVDEAEDSGDGVGVLSGAPADASEFNVIDTLFVSIFPNMNATELYERLPALKNVCTLVGAYKMLAASGKINHLPDLIYAYFSTQVSILK